MKTTFGSVPRASVSIAPQYSMSDVLAVKVMLDFTFLVTHLATLHCQSACTAILLSQLVSSSACHLACFYQSSVSCIIKTSGIKPVHLLY